MYSDMCSDLNLMISATSESKKTYSHPGTVDFARVSSFASGKQYQRKREQPEVPSGKLT